MTVERHPDPGRGLRHHSGTPGLTNPPAGCIDTRQRVPEGTWPWNGRQSLGSRANPPVGLQPAALSDLIALVRVVLRVGGVTHRPNLVMFLANWAPATKLSEAAGDVPAPPATLLRHGTQVREALAHRGSICMFYPDGLGLPWSGCSTFIGCLRRDPSLCILLHKAPSN